MQRVISNVRFCQLLANYAHCYAVVAFWLAQYSTTTTRANRNTCPFPVRHWVVQYMLSQWRIQGGRQGHAPSSCSKFFYFHAVFHKYVVAPPSGVDIPSSGKSWIRHCKWWTVQPGGIHLQVFHLLMSLMCTRKWGRIRMLHWWIKKQFEHGLGGNTFLDGYKITLLIRGRMNFSSMIDLKIISWNDISRCKKGDVSCPREVRKTLLDLMGSYASWCEAS